MTDSGTTVDELALTLAAATDAEVNITAADRDDFATLDRVKRAKREHENAAKALGKDAQRLVSDLLMRRVERGWEVLPSTVDEQGQPIKPYTRTVIRSKYAVDPETGKPYERAQVGEVLDDAGLGHLIVVGFDSDGLARHITAAVKAWRRRAGETGVTSAEHGGAHVDAFGHPLLGDELDDPTADRLALHPVLRALLGPVDMVDILFSRG